MEAFIGSILVVPYNFAPVGWASCAGQLLQVNQNQALFSLIGNIYGGTATTFGLPDLRGRSVVGSMTNGTGTPVATYTLGQKGGALTQDVSQVPVHTHTAVPALSLSGASASGSVNLPVTASFSSQTVTVSGSLQATTVPGSTDVPFNGATIGDVSPGTTTKLYVAPSTDPTKQVLLSPITSTGTFGATSTGSATGNVSLPVTGGSLSGTVTVQPAGSSVSVATVGPFLALNPIMCMEGIYPQKP